MTTLRSTVANPLDTSPSATLTLSGRVNAGQGAFAEKAGGYYAVGVHEFSHRVEDVVPGVITIEEQFLERRTTDPATGEKEPLLPLPGGKPWGEPEVARPDNFVTAYIGREYPSVRYSPNFTEVLSMGSEALFAGEHGGLVGTGRFARDDDMRATILGIHAAVGRPVQERAPQW